MSSLEFQLSGNPNLADNASATVLPIIYFIYVYTQSCLYK